VEDGGHECVPDLAVTQLVFRRLCIGRAVQVDNIKIRVESAYGFSA